MSLNKKDQIEKAVDNALQIGELSETGALIIDNQERNAIAEQAIDLMATGDTLVQAAEKLDINSDTLRTYIGRNAEYDRKYARIKICRYVDMIERLITFVDGLEEEVDHKKTYKLDKQYDAYKFAIGKYDMHLANAVRDSNLGGNPSAQSPSIVINVAQPVQVETETQVHDVDTQPVSD